MEDWRQIPGEDRTDVDLLLTMATRLRTGRAILLTGDHQDKDKAAAEKYSHGEIMDQLWAALRLQAVDNPFGREWRCFRMKWYRSLAAGEPAEARERLFERTKGLMKVRLISNLWS
jgi:hypothetical protein